MMLQVLSTLWVIIGLATCVYNVTHSKSCPVCYKCKVTLEPSRSTVLQETKNHNNNCNLTLTQLLDCVSNHEDNSTCASKEIMFLSGTHQVDTEHGQLQPWTLQNFKRIVIRGQPNAIIACRNPFCFNFTNVSSVTIQNIHVKNCSCSFGAYGVFFDIGGDFSTAKVEITNSIFTNSGINFRQLKQLGSEMNAILIYVVHIDNSTFQNCDTVDPVEPIIRYEELYASFNVFLKNLNVTHNSRPFLELLVAADVGNHSSMITLTGKHSFTYNNGFIISVRYNTLRFVEADVNFSFNNATDSFSNSTVQVYQATVLIKCSYLIFNSNRGLTSGGISARNTRMVFSENTTTQFMSNSGIHGGALYLDSESTLVFNATNSNTSLEFVNNSAWKGGAIYVKDDCRVMSVFDLEYNVSVPKFTLCNNSASFSGNNIYGGWVDWMRNDDSDGVSYKPNVIVKMFDFRNDSDVSSSAVRICLCVDDRPNCSVTNYSTEVYGYALSLSVVAIGQRYTPVSTNIKASLKGRKFEYPEEEKLYLWPTTEIIQTSCKFITYKFKSCEESLLLEPKSDYCGDRECDDIIKPKYNCTNDSVTCHHREQLFEKLSVHMNFKRCPCGFSLDKTNRSCLCQPWVSSLGLTCDTLERKINRKKQQWFGVTRNHTEGESDCGMIVHTCPLGYCSVDRESLSVKSDDPELDIKLCAFNRTGTLCGACKANYSRVLGSIKCKKCSTSWRLLPIILSWLVIGPSLVFVLMLLDITVSAGTINGLTFYVNIIQSQHATFFPSHSFFAQCIA